MSIANNIRIILTHWAETEKREFKREEIEAILGNELKTQRAIKTYLQIIMKSDFIRRITPPKKRGGIYFIANAEELKRLIVDKEPIPERILEMITKPEEKAPEPEKVQPKEVIVEKEKEAEIPEYITADLIAEGIYRKMKKLEYSAMRLEEDNQKLLNIIVDLRKIVGEKSKEIEKLNQTIAMKNPEARSVPGKFKASELIHFKKRGDRK